MAQLNFDASQVAPSEALEAIPAGWYNAQMTASEMKPTSDGTGAYLQAEFTVLSGDYAGRKLFDRINLQNKNPVAVEIGYKTLSAICHAVNVIQVQDSQQLHGRPLQLKVSLRAAGPGADGKHYEASNDVKGYKALDGAGVPMAGAPAGGAPSWAPQAPAQPAPQQWTPPAQPAAAPQQWQQQPAPQQAPSPQQWTPPAPQPAPVAQQQPAQTPPWQAPAQPAPQQAAAPTPPWQGQPAPAAQPAPQGGAPVPPWAQPAQ